MRKLLIASLAALAFAAPAAASAQETAATEAVDEVAAATDFAKSLTAAATAALTKAGASDAEKLAEFQGVLARGLALETIGKFMIGDARKTMSEAQLARYDAVFSPYITKQYAEQFADIVGKPLKVVDAKKAGRDVFVRTEFPRTGAAPINVDWRVRALKSGELKAIDIIVSGVSIMLVKREEFSAFIAQNGVDALLDRLEAEGKA